MNTSLRVRACFKCKKYIILHPDNSISQKLENKFNIYHSGHTIYVMALDKITSDYKNEKPSDYRL